MSPIISTSQKLHAATKHGTSACLLSTSQNVTMSNKIDDYWWRPYVSIKNETVQLKTLLPSDSF